MLSNYIFKKPKKQYLSDINVVLWVFSLSDNVSNNNILGFIRK